MAHDNSFDGLSDEQLEGISGGWGKPCPNRDWGCDSDGYNIGE